MNKATPFNNERLALVFLALALLLPFANRPLFVDDHPVYKQAIDIISHPTIPYPDTTNTSVGWTKGESPSEPNPALYFYLMGTYIHLVGQEEWKAHLLIIGVTILGLLAFYSLANRFCKNPLWPSLLLLVTPHFWLTANTLMLDALVAPFMLIGLTLWIHGWEKERHGYLFSAAIILGLTPLIKYTGLLLWAVVILWTVTQRKDWKSRKWLYFLIPIGIFLMWLFWTKAIYGDSHLFAAMGNGRINFSIYKIVIFMSFVAGTTIPMILSPITSLSQLKKNTRPIILGLLFMALGTWLFKEFGLSPAFQIGLLSGLFFTWGILTVKNIKEDKRTGWLAAWVLMGLVGLSLVRDWLCSRYLVILTPPIVLLTALYIEKNAKGFFKTKRFRILSLVLIGSFSGLLAISDYHHASIDKKVVSQVQDWIAKTNVKNNVYYPETILSAMSFYADKKFLKGIAPGQKLKPGDFALLPINSLPERFYPALSHPKGIKTFSHDTPIPLRTLGSRSLAGFYGTVWGPLPFSFSLSPQEVYVLVQEKGPKA